MGGYGSGRSGFASCRPTCESYCSIDLAYLRRHGLLKPGRSSSMSWSRGGQQTGSISLIAQHDGVRLVYWTKDRDGAQLDVNELVPFVYTPTMFGGRRQWLQCLKCGRGCRKIYGGRYFRCRQCHRLVYASTREPAYQRAMDRADKLRKRLGDKWGSAFEHDEFPAKPPRMRWITYRRLEEQYDDLQRRWVAGAMARLGRF
jgi:DNA-directed RNA polymerase subunit RPC12/RpoP